MTRETRPDHIIFDFFGTLVEYKYGPSASLRKSGELVRSLGAIATDVQLRGELDAVWEQLETTASETLREQHVYEAASLLLVRLALQADHDLIEAFTEAYIEDWQQSVHTISGVREMIQRVGIPASVVSNTHHPLLVPREIERHGLADLFEGVWTSVEHGYRKPHPSIYRLALATIRAPAEDVLFVGDNPECDYHGPRKAGMSAVLVAPEPVEDIPEGHRISHILELESWLTQQS